MMGDDAGRVDIFADLGVRVIQLTYNPHNQLGDGSMVPDNMGLSRFRPRGCGAAQRTARDGRSVAFRRADLPGCRARAHARPISINHTGCRALVDLPRNKTDAELRLVASKGGFVGIYFMPFLTLDGHPHAEDVVAHIEHAVNVCGEDHVGIGTDGVGHADRRPRAYQVAISQQEIEERRARPASAPPASGRIPIPSSSICAGRRSSAS